MGKEADLAVFEVPLKPSGPQYSFGNRFDGIPFDHPAFVMRATLMKRNNRQPEFRDLPTTIGNSTGVK